MNDLLVCFQAMSASARRHVATAPWEPGPWLASVSQVLADGCAAVGITIEELPTELRDGLRRTAIRIILAHRAEQERNARWLASECVR